ncbi:MAG: hypothetical protein QOE58_1227 [Actinomycetota bacterium]|jgi:hypothetical protein|nr:hypothetical protein [Actinomycetota bacterium]
MSLAMARKVADAVLYEGYVLFPYRAGTMKNQIRWQFGVVVPKAYTEYDSSERSAMRTECLIDVGKDTEIDIKLRFLRVQDRTVEQAVDGGWVLVEALEYDDKIVSTWQEAVEEEHDLTLSVADLLEKSHDVPLEFEATAQTEDLVSDGGAVVGRFVRQTWGISAVARISAERMIGPISMVKVTVLIENLTDWGSDGATTRDDLVRRSLAAVHTLMEVRGGSFISLADPPEFARPAVASCRNEGTWPVLIGDEDKHNVILSSPITLSDFPEVAPESDGDFYDATEVDEMLHLFVNSLSEEEKREARGTDPRAADIIDRVDTLPPEMMEKLHGAIRSLRPIPLHGKDEGATTRMSAVPAPDLAGEMGAFSPFEGESDPWQTYSTDPDGNTQNLSIGLDAETDGKYKPFEDTTVVNGVEVGKGTKVRLQPTGGSDAQDMFLVGLTATVEGVFNDIDGDIHLAVSIDDDPATTELPDWYGRYRYFRLNEVEVLG